MLGVVADKVDDWLLGRGELPAAIVATTGVEANLKSSVVEGGVDMGGWLHKREVVSAGKCLKKGRRWWKFGE